MSINFDQIRTRHTKYAAQTSIILSEAMTNVTIERHAVAIRQNV